MENILFEDYGTRYPKYSELSGIQLFSHIIKIADAFNRKTENDSIDFLVSLQLFLDSKRKEQNRIRNLTDLENLFKEKELFKIMNFKNTDKYKDSDDLLIKKLYFYLNSKVLRPDGELTEEMLDLLFSIEKNKKSSTLSNYSLDNQQKEFMKLTRRLSKNTNYQAIYNVCRLFVITGGVRLNIGFTSEKDFEKLEAKLNSLLTEKEKENTDIHFFVNDFKEKLYVKQKIRRTTRYCEGCFRIIENKKNANDCCDLEYCYHNNKKIKRFNNVSEVYKLNFAFEKFVKIPGFIELEAYLLLKDILKKMKLDHIYTVLLFPGIERYGDVALIKDKEYILKIDAKDHTNVISLVDKLKNKEEKTGEKFRSNVLYVATHKIEKQKNFIENSGVLHGGVVMDSVKLKEYVEKMLKEAN